MDIKLIGEWGYVTPGPSNILNLAYLDVPQQDLVIDMII